MPRNGQYVHWTDEDAAGRGVRQRGFVVEVGGRCVPGLLWTPVDAAGPRPVVAIGHGGSDDKRQGVVVSMARRLVRHHAMAAVAIDGPVHGARRSDGGADRRLTTAEFGQRWAGDGDLMTDTMVADWRGAVAAVQQLPEVGSGPIGYWGLSMGTILGLPLVAAERRVAACVLGLMGMTGPTRARIAADAPRVRCPVLFLAQADDELFPLDAALELFVALGSADKRLHVHPGGHGQVPREELDASEAFLASRLGGAGC